MTWIAGHLGTVYLAIEWAIRLTMVAWVPFRRSPEAARSWLLLLLFLPVPGLVLYMLIGRPGFPKWRRLRFARMPQLLPRDDTALREAQEAAPPLVPPERRPVERLALRLGGLGAVGDNRVEVIAEYRGAIDRIIADIDGARDHVHLLVYIFADDDVGRAVIAALARAAGRGVRCRVLIDALGSRRWITRVIAALRAADVEAHQLLPIRAFRSRPARADLRNHRKLIVIDGRTGYVGSQNIVDAGFRPGVVNEELVARVEGAIVAQIQAVFVSDWYLETEQALAGPALLPAPATDGASTLQLLPSGPDYPVAGAERLTVALIYAARRQVVITTPYLIPDEGLIEGLQSAVLRGVDVRLVLSLVQDQWLVGMAQRSFYAELLRSGVRIFLYRDRLLHAKHLTVDHDLATIGSSNVDIRSFTLNAEATLIVYDPAVIRELHAIQADYFAGSTELDAAEWATRPVHHKLGENLARLVSPLL